MRAKRNYAMAAIIVSLFFSGISWAGINEEEREYMPDSHRSRWMEKHQQYAKSDSQSCSSCHQPIFCIDCHERRDSITERVHKRNWKFYHSVKARANPRKCDSCHQVDFCTDCHRNPR